MFGRKVGIAPYLILPVLVVALALAMVTSVRAGDPSDQFEIDGNWPHDGAQLRDWDNVGPLSFVDASGVKETIITPGNDLFGTFPYPTTPDGNSPNKADLTGAWLSSVVDGDSLYLYLAAQRAPSQQGGDPGGNTSAIFALHRDAGTLNAGDLIIVMDFVNGGSVSVPTAYQYNGSTWEDLGLTAAVADAISNPAGAIGPQGVALPANVFVEAGIHLTDAGLLSGGSCLNATQLWIMTSSSDSNNASLKDVMNGGRIDLNNAGVPVTNCGDVSVTKVVQGDAPDSTWEISISPNVDNFTTQVIGDGQSTVDVQINPNTPVTITETSVEGLDFTATWECSDGTSSAEPSVGSLSFQVTASAFEHIDCTITNVVDELPAVSVSKTAGSATVPQTGGDVTYTFVVENSGGVPVTITDLDDDVFGALAGDADCQVGTTLATAGSCQFDATFSLAAAAPGTEHTNVFTATVEDEQENETSDSDDATVTYTDVLPEVSAGKVANPDEVVETGDDVTFTFTVMNAGTVPVEITSLEDDKLGTLAGDADCQVGTVLAPGASCDFEETISIPAGSLGQSHVNIFTVTVEDEDGTEDSHSAEETVTYTDVPPMVNVTKTASPTSVPQSGGDVTFTYTVENSGTVSATITVLSDDQFGALAGDADCQVGTVLAGGASCQFAAVFAVPAGAPGSSHVNVFTATLVDADQNADSDTDDAEVSYSDLLPSITVSKDANPTSVGELGGDVTFTFTVSNTGDETVTIVSLSDSEFGALAGDADCQAGTVLGLGQSCDFSQVFPIPAGTPGDTHVNVFTATAVDGDQAEASDSDDATVTYTDIAPQVTVSKSAQPNTVVQSGGDVTYTFTVTNSGAVSAEIISLVDDAFGTLTGDAGCEVGTVLGAGNSCDFEATFTLPADQPGATHVNTFTATVEDAQGNEDSDSDDATVTYTDVPATITMTKTPNPSSVTAPGANVTYTVSVTNSSPVDSVVINSLVDDKFGDLDGQGTCVLDQPLGPGDSYSCEFTGNVTGSAGTTHENTITAGGYSTDNEQKVEAEASATVTITSAPPPPPPPPPPPQDEEPVPAPEPAPAPQVLGSTAQIEKELTSADTARVGEQVTFRVRLTVSGDTDVTEVGIIDTFEHEFLEYVGSSGICELVPNFPDAAHSSIGCPIGTVSPGVGNEPGTKVFEYNLTFNALKATIPERTVNEALAVLDLDGDGPGAPAEIGPASADVEIVEILGLQLPPTGDGSSAEDAGGSHRLIVGALIAAVALGLVQAVQRRRLGIR